MWTIIVVIITFFISRFLWDYFRQNQEVSRQGGMSTKYQELIGLLSGSSLKRQNVSKNSITYSGKVAYGTMFFTLTQTFGKVTVEWGNENSMLGRHSRKWIFDENDNQRGMYDTMVNALNKEQESPF